jgi:small GTP-binding protein
MSLLPIQGKICILGEFSVGKTSLVRRYVEGIFDDRYLSTIGVKVSRRVVDLGGDQQVTLIIWDVAGSEEFNGKHTSYLQGSSATLLVCDLTRGTTLPSLRKYVQRMREVEPGAGFVVIANKNDLADQHELTTGDLISFAEEIQAEWFVTSAKTGENVEQAFLQLAKVMAGA